MKIEVTVTNEGFVYKDYLIKPYEDWVSIKDQTDVVWFGAEKFVDNVWYWKKRICLLQLIEDIDNE